MQTNIFVSAFKHLTSLLGILIGNIVPVAVVIIEKGSVEDLLFFYWLETVLIVVVMMIRMLVFGFQGKASLFWMTLFAAAAGAFFAAFLYFMFWLGINMAVIRDTVNGTLDHLPDMADLDEPLKVLQEAMRPGVWSCIAGFIAGQGFSFFDRYKHAEHYREAPAMEVFGHTMQRFLLLMAIWVTGSTAAIIGSSMIFFALAMLVLKLIYELWENSRFFDPLA